jgi:hypothetical protein
VEALPPDREARGFADRIMALGAADREIMSEVINALRARRRKKARK